MHWALDPHSFSCGSSKKNIALDISLRNFKEDSLVSTVEDHGLSLLSRVVETAFTKTLSMHLAMLEQLLN